MSKKLHGKLLSVILCIAICCATFCGSIIAVNAAAADFNGTYTISVGDEKQAVPFGTNEVKAQVKFDLPAGFVGGQFTAEAQYDAEGVLISKAGDGVTVVAATKKDGTPLELTDANGDPVVSIVSKADGDNKMVRFVIGDGVLCTSITIEYTLLISNYVANGTTTKYPVSITLSEDDLVQFATYDLQDVTFTASAESDGWFHSHSSWYGTNGVVLDAENNGKHTVVTNARCHWCTTSVANGGLGLPMNENYIAQVLPDYTEFDGVTTPVIADGDTDGDAHTAWIGISGATVRYNENGGLDVDVHVYSQYRTGNNDKVVLFVCDEEGNELYRLGPVANGTSYYAGNGLHANTKMFTINGLSARDIEKNLLLTAIEYSSGAIEHSRTMPFCLADYCESVVDGNGAVWASGATQEQIEADKDVAAALYYYGAAIDESVFDKNTSAGSDIDYINANYDEWDSTKSTTFTEGSGTEGEPYIIKTAEQLAYVALEAGSTVTNGVYYKVAPNSVFNMNGMTGITLDSTATDVVNATKNSAFAWTMTADWFEGHFDGNGVVIYNINSNSDTAALFPKVRNTSTVKNVIENITVVASFFKGFHQAAGIIANAANNTGSTNIDMYFNNCVVKNCYIGDQGNTNSATNKISAGIVANAGYNIVNIDNCAVINNNIDGGNIKAAFVAQFATNTVLAGKITNSIAVGTIPYSVKGSVGDREIMNAAITTSVFNNIYTDQTVDAAYTGITAGVSTGVGAVEKMNFDNDWFNTADSYPELNIFHKLSKQYVDENTHKVICVLKAGDNTCSLKGVTEEHTFLENDEGTLLICECGYSKEIIGNTVVLNNKKIVKWDGNTTSSIADASVSAGTIDDPIEITTPSELAYLAKSVGSASDGLYYKVADGIAVFDFSGYTWAATSNATPFAGHFDGNGVIFKNINGQQGVATALFACVNASNSNKAVSFKNITIVDSSFYMSSSAYSNGAAAIVGWNSGGDYYNPGTITIENCVVKNTTFTSMGSAASSVATAGILCGNVTNAYINIDNCFLSGNTVTVPESVTSYGGLIGAASNFGVTISNTICLGMSPITNGSGRAYYLYRADAFSNVYTDQTVDTNVYVKEKLQQLSTANMIGTGVVSKMGLDSSVWFDTASYPELDVFHDMIDIYVDEDTHKSVCQVYIDGTQQCTTCGPTEEHVLDTNAEGTAKVCSCGYSEEIIGNTVTPNNVGYDTWDGTMEAPTKGTGIEADPYLIENAEQLAFIALSLDKEFETKDKYFKVADGIKVFNMQGMYGVTLDSTSNEVKSLTNAGKIWRQTADITSDNRIYGFSGNFDGNGVTIYNMHYGSGNGHAYSGLFPFVYQTGSQVLTFKNFTVAASYFKGYHAASGAVGYTYPVNTGSQIVFENVVVKNNYIISELHSQIVAGLVANMSHNKISVNNCAIIDNEMVGAGMVGGFFATSSGHSGGCDIKNSIVIGTAPTHPTNASVNANSTYSYSNIYTDQDFDASYTGITKGVPTASQLGDGWFDTESYPELSVFHDMITIYIDANTHQNVCQHFINGVQCTTCGPVATHTMVDSDDGQYSECACGYSYEIKGIHAMGLPTSILNRITSNATFAEKFATNALFRAAYNEDVFGGEGTKPNEFEMYTTSLNLKVNPHIGFMFAFHGDYKANRGNITVTFTVDGENYTTEAVETNGTLGTNWVNNSGAGRYHLYRFKELPVSKLCKDVKVTVNYNGATYDFGTYSAAGYAINAMNAGEDYQYHVNASMALVYYSEMLAARAGV